MQLTVSQSETLHGIWEELIALGFDLADMGQNSYSINAIPAGIEGIDVRDLIGQMLVTASRKNMMQRPRCKSVWLGLWPRRCCTGGTVSFSGRNVVYGR